MKRKIIRVAIGVGVLLVLLCFAPLPSRIQAAYPTVNYADQSGDEPAIAQFSIDGWRLNYLFRGDRVRGKMSLAAEDKTLFDATAFEALRYELGPLETLGDVEYLAFLYYDGDANRHLGCEVYIARKQQFYIVKHESGALYIAPAENREEAQKVVDYFSEYIEIPLE